MQISILFPRSHERSDDLPGSSAVRINSPLATFPVVPHKRDYRKLNFCRSLSD